MDEASADIDEVELLVVGSPSLVLSQPGGSAGLLNGAFTMSADLGDIGSELRSEIVVSGGRPVGYTRLDVVLRSIDIDDREVDIVLIGLSI